MRINEGCKINSVWVGNNMVSSHNLIQTGEKEMASSCGHAMMIIVVVEPEETCTSRASSYNTLGG